MEIFLLLLDELDDAAAILRVLWSRFLGFFVACGLFASSVMVAMHWPIYWPILAAVLVIGAVVGATLPARSIRLPRFKTDP
jgi:membrane associated rhomboid family serine protease